MTHEELLKKVEDKLRHDRYILGIARDIRVITGGRWGIGIDIFVCNDYGYDYNTDKYYYIAHLSFFNFGDCIRQTRTSRAYRNIKSLLNWIRLSIKYNVSDDVSDDINIIEDFVDKES